MSRLPLNYSRPSRTFDGEGSRERLSASPDTLYGEPLITADAELSITVAEDTPVQVGDLVEIPKHLYLGDH